MIYYQNFGDIMTIFKKQTFLDIIIMLGSTEEKKTEIESNIY